MAEFVTKHARISGIATVTGNIRKRLDEELDIYGWDAEQAERLKKTIGFDTRYVTDETTTTCDLCEQAAKKLLRELGLDAQDIGAIVSVTQTPDYFMPGNAHILHERLGLAKSSMAMDLEFGCSGYVYGLLTAFLLAENSKKNVLLVTGDTLSKLAHPRDRSEAPLFGDAGSATLISYSEKESPAYFLMRSDGTGVKKMYQPAGAYRIRPSEETRKEIDDGEGNIRTAENIYMNGFEIFNFTLSEQPRMLNDILALAGKEKDDIDYFVLHQANVYIVETILRKAKISLDKAPSKVFSKYGNQNSASVPGAFCADLHDKLTGKKSRAVLLGYGIGLSWGACCLELDDVKCLEMVPYQKEGNQNG